MTSKDPDGFSVIHLAACQENPESIIILTKTLNKTLLNVKDHLGRTPLIYACLMGFDKNVELLLEQKVIPYFFVYQTRILHLQSFLGTDLQPFRAGQ